MTLRLPVPGRSVYRFDMGEKEKYFNMDEGGTGELSRMCPGSPRRSISPVRIRSSSPGRRISRPVRPALGRSRSVGILYVLTDAGDSILHHSPSPCTTFVFVSVPCPCLSPELVPGTCNRMQNCALHHNSVFYPLLFFSSGSILSARVLLPSFAVFLFFLLISPWTNRHFPNTACPFTSTCTLLLAMQIF